VNLEEVVPAAIASLGERAYGVVYDVPETLNPVRADAALLERSRGESHRECDAVLRPRHPARITGRPAGTIASICA